jgi:hypothetical protein
MIKYLMVFMLSLFGTRAVCCDICGCGLTARSFGILPQFNKNFIGLRLQYRNFDSEHPPLFDSQLPQFSNELYYNTELWGRLNPVKRLQIFYFIPYQKVVKRENSSSSIYEGLGDISIMANYIILNNSDTSGNIWKNVLQAGGGIKMPTGKSNIPEKDGYILMNLQPGTGGFAIPVNLIYTVRYKGFGLNSEFNYMVQFKSKNKFRFGNRTQLGFKLFYWQDWNNVSFLPAAGLNFMHASPDRDLLGIIGGSGGENINGTLGADIFVGRLNIGFNAQIPLYQHMTDGNVKIKENISTSLTFNF